MKQKIFTLVLMLAMVFVASSAWAQVTPPAAGNKYMPYPGSTHTYNLSTVQVGTAGGTFDLTSDLANVRVSAVTGHTGDYTFGTDVAIANGNSFTLSFTIAYDDDPLATGTYVRVTVTDGGCSNYINMPIEIQPLPTFEIAITNVGEACQELNASPDDFTAANVGADINTITFTVTPNVEDIAATTPYSYTYTIDLSAAGLTGYTVVHTSGSSTGAASNSAAFAMSGTMTGVDPTPDLFTITFTTTTGINDVVIPGTIVSGSMTITSSGGGTYAAADVSDDFTVATMPRIGSFD